MIFSPMCMISISDHCIIRIRDPEMDLRLIYIYPLQCHGEVMACWDKGLLSVEGRCWLARWWTWTCWVIIEWLFKWALKNSGLNNVQISIQSCRSHENLHFAKHVNNAPLQSVPLILHNNEKDAWLYNRFSEFFA